MKSLALLLLALMAVAAAGAAVMTDALSTAPEPTQRVAPRSVQAGPATERSADTAIAFARAAALAVVQEKSS